MIILFDVDGTLCDTCVIDTECFLRACSDALDHDVRACDWSAAPHISDAGIVNWLWHQYHERPPHTEEVQSVMEHYLKLLQEAVTRSPGQFRAIPGAVALWQAPPSGYHMAAATGGWQAAARLKLQAAGLPADALVASSTDTPDRVAIFQRGAERMTRGLLRSNDIILVGDGIWDVQVAAVLGWRFVGRGDGAHADALRCAGASHVIRDFTDRSLFDTAIAASSVPVAPRPPAAKQQIAGA